MSELHQRSLWLLEFELGNDKFEVISSSARTSEILSRYEEA
jgi:hypothetical protein